MNAGCFKLYDAYSISFNSSNLELNSKGLYQNSGKERKVVVFCSRPRQNVKLGTEKYKKSVMHVQSCCFANLNLLLFFRSRSRRFLGDGNAGDVKHSPYDWKNLSYAPW